MFKKPNQQFTWQQVPFHVGCLLLYECLYKHDVVPIFMVLTLYGYLFNPNNMCTYQEFVVEWLM